MKRLFCAGVMLSLFGCPPAPPIPDGGVPDGSVAIADAGCANGYCVYILDPAQMGLVADYVPQISAAEGPSGRVGVAYYKQDAGTSADGGIDVSYAVQYLEWTPGAAFATPEVVQVVHLAYGLSLAFQGSGQPAVAYLGGPPDIAGVGVYWLNHDTAVSYRSAPGVWAEQLAVQVSGEAPTWEIGNVTSNQGAVVGLYPALAFNGNTAHVVYRDVHNAQSVGTGDYNGSDFELASGGPTAWTHQMLIPGGLNKQGWGGHPSLLVANGRPAAAFDRVFSSGGSGVPAAPGSDVYFVRQTDDGGTGWTFPAVLVSTAGDTGNGPSLAHRDGGFFGIAFSDKLNPSGQALYLSESMTDGKTWNPRDVVEQYGSSGWYPSLRYDPQYGDPVIVYYQCASTGGIGQLGTCPTSQDELRLATRVSGYWYYTTVDPEGGLQPKLLYRSDGRRLVVYRDVHNGNVKIAVEQ